MAEFRRYRLSLTQASAQPPNYTLIMTSISISIYFSPFMHSYSSAAPSFDTPSERSEIIFSTVMICTVTLYFRVPIIDNREKGTRNESENAEK